MPTNLQIVYDDLLSLYDQVKADYDSGKFDGESAYEIAVDNGFKGSEEEWLESLRYDHSDEFEQLATQVKQDADRASKAMTSATETAQENIKAIQSETEQATSSIQNAQATAEQSVSNKTTEALSSLESAKTQATSDITTAKDEAIEEIENTGVPLEDIEKLAIKQTVQGNPTIVSDSADWRLQKLNVYGQSEQASTTGINILDYPKKKALDSEYYDVDENGYVIQLQKDNRVNNTLPEIIKLPSGQYTAMVESDSTPTTNFQLYDLTNDKQIASPNSPHNYFTRFTLDGETSISFKVYKPDGTLAKARVQISKGSEVVSWEPYTGGKPSPSPDYPQEIKSVEVSGITICGENLLPLDVDIQIITAGIYLYKNIGFMLKKGIKYVLSVKSNVEGLYAIPFDETNPDNSPFKVYGGDTVEFTPTETGKYYFHAYNSNGITDEQKILWLNIGEKKPYTEYKSQTITLSEPITLRGIPVSSGGNVTIDGQQYVSDVICEKDGQIGAYRFNKYDVFDGSDDESLSVGAYLGNVTRTTITISNSLYNITYSNKFKFIDNYDLDEPHFYYWNNVLYLFVPVQLTTQRELRDWLKENQVGVLYTLETPTFEPLPEEVQKQYKELKSYHPNTVIQTGCFNEVEYVADTKMYIDNKLAGVTELALGGK